MPSGGTNFGRNCEVPSRLIIAYALIGVIIIALVVGGVLIRRRHIRRKQNIRGNRGYR
jgi:hypothetical protein